MSPVSIRLKEWRMRRGLTQAQLAELAGVRRAMLSEIESGRRTNIELHTVALLCDALDVSPAQLLRWTKASHPHRRRK
jgi:transcriptional regulator with XRE-family HTH domain